MAPATSKVTTDGRLISSRFDEDVPSAKEDLTVTASIGDVAGSAEVVAHLARAGALPLASITSKLGPTGEVQELQWVINSSAENRFDWKIPAKRLFTAAPAHCYIGGSHRWEEFGFLAGEFITGWRSSADINISFFKRKNSAETYTSNEVKEWGVFNFVVRLGLSLNEDINKATVLVLAMPVSEAGLGDLPGYEGPGIKYPHVCLHSADVDLGPLIDRRTGQPLRVFVHHVEQEEPDWEPREIWEHVRELMSNPRHTETSASLEAWHTTTRGPDAPAMPDQRQAFSWPLLPENNARESNGTLCLYPIFAIFWDDVMVQTVGIYIYT